MLYFTDTLYLAPAFVGVLFFFGSGLSLGVTTCCMADVIDYGEMKRKK